MHRLTHRSALRASLQVQCLTPALHTIRSRSFTRSSLILAQSNNQTINRSINRQSNSQSNDRSNNQSIKQTFEPQPSTSETKRVIKSLIDEERYLEAIDIAHKKSLIHGADSSAFLGVFPGLEKHRKSKHSETEMSLLCEIWDACYALKTLLNMKTMHQFAIAFDRVNDTKRILELAQLLIKTHHTVPFKHLPFYALMLHLVMTHVNTAELHNQSINQSIKQSLQQRITQAIGRTQLSLGMLQHEGAIESMLDKLSIDQSINRSNTQQLDEAVQYLRHHAASLEVGTSDWNHVLTALYRAKLQDQALDLYNHWLSVLSPIDQIKKRSNYKRIVPSIITYVLLSGRGSLSAEHVFAQLDKFDIPSDTRLFESMIQNAIGKRDHTNVLLCYDRMISSNIALSAKMLSDLVGFVREYRTETTNVVDANRFAAMLWDHLLERHDVTSEPGWFLTFMDTFDETGDVKRILQLADVIMTSPHRITQGVLVKRMVTMLSKNRQTKKYVEFNKWKLVTLSMNDLESLPQQASAATTLDASEQNTQNVEELASWIANAGIDDMPKNESIAVMQIVSRLKETNLEAASSMLHKVQAAGSMSDMALNDIARTKELPFAPKHTRSRLPFISQLWDLCYATETPLLMGNMYYFAMSFDRANDSKHLLELADLMIKTPMQMPRGLQVCSLMLHLLSSQHHVDVLTKLEHHITGYIASDPSLSLSTLRHQGAIDSMLDKQQIDQAVKYICKHAADLELDSVVWNRVVTALCSAGQADQAMGLYKHWLSALPPIDQLKQRSGFKRIVPDAVTYGLLWRHCAENSSLSVAGTLAQLDKFGISPDTGLYEIMIRKGIRERDHQAVFLCWDHMCDKDVKMTDEIMSLLVHFVRMFGKKPEHIAGADRRVVMLWDHRANIVLSFGSYLFFMEAFNRTHDIDRMLQLVDVIMSGPKPSGPEPITKHISEVLEKNNQTEKQSKFNNWISGVDSDATSFDEAEAAQQVVSHLDEKNFESATDVLHKMKSAGPAVSNTVFATILSSNALQCAPSQSEATLSFSTQLWDLCHAANISLSTDNLNYFAVSFDRSNDSKRILELSDLMITTPMQMPHGLQVCSRMLHLVASHDNVDVLTNLKQYITGYIASDPSLSLAMLQHQGAISSMLDKQQVDQAAQYLRDHAASLELDSVAWNRVMTALCSAKQTDQAMGLYKHWISMLPPIDQLKQRSDFKRIVPDVATYDLLLRHPTVDSPLSAQYVLSRIDEFDLPSDPTIYEHIIKDVVSVTDALMCWDHMRNRDIKMTEVVMTRLIDFIRVSSMLSTDASLAVMLWDHRANFAIHLRWALIFMKAFDRAGDIARMLQVVDVITTGPKPGHETTAILSDIAALLTKKKQTKKLVMCRAWSGHDSSPSSDKPSKVAKARTHNQTKNVRKPEAQYDPDWVPPSDPEVQVESVVSAARVFSRVDNAFDAEFKATPSTQSRKDDWKSLKA